MIVFACSSEDADWLGKGIIDNLQIKNLNIAIFWNLITQAMDDKDLTISPIIKTYIEDIKKCDTLIICKSIIYNSCVVRTNLTYLINEINPKKIIIASPVLFKTTKESLSKEFDNSISSKFEFVYFAVDNKVTPQGEVVPGIGGNIYNRLGFSDLENKNKYIPKLVVNRREKHQRSENSVDIEFEVIKNSKFSSFRHHTLNDIVDNWLELRNDKNDNIQTIKYFVENPDVLKYECLSYDKKGLADGHHRLIAMKIIGLRNFCYKYEDEYSGD